MQKENGGYDKRCITATLCESLDGTMLPFQLMYEWKTERTLPSYYFPEGFSLSFNTGAMKLKLFD